MKYLLFASHSYSYAILRPIEEEVWKRGEEVSWFLEDTCQNLLTDKEIQIKSIDEVINWNPDAVIAPGNWIYHFFPGVKVHVFHGFPIHKRTKKKDEFFDIKGWFDIYCTQGETGTAGFKEIEKKLKFFKVYETGYPKSDSIVKMRDAKRTTSKPTILYAPTFTKGISSVWQMGPIIKQMAENRDWQFIIRFHPKITDPVVIKEFKDLAATHQNIDFPEYDTGLQAFADSDVMLADSSSVIMEYMLTDKPVVTFKNTHPGDYLVNVDDLSKIESSIELALSRPEDLMKRIRAYTLRNEARQDGCNSARVLDAIADFISNYKGKIKSKPFNLFRKFKLCKRLKYWKF